MKIFEAFGLDIRILIAQLVNFAILFFVLYKFGYKPMFKMLEDRKNKIESGLENAALAEERLKQIGEEEKKTMTEAKKEAAKLIDEARAQAEDNRKKLIEKTKEEIGQLINQEKANMQLEKAEVLKSINNEVAGLVAAAVEKVIEEKLNGAKDEELIKKAIGKLR